MSERILLDTGPSERGFHRIEAYLRCPQLFAWGYGQAGSRDPKVRERSISRFPPTPPLVRGSLGHVGLAHLYARQKATQCGADPAVYHLPLKAMELVAAKFGDLGAEMLPIAVKAVRAYVNHYFTEKRRILAVEEQEETLFHGDRYTARVDLEWIDRAGKVWFTDHKFCSKLESKTLRRYLLSGQFLGLQWLGARKFGDQFGGVEINLIGCGDPISFLRKVPDPAPYRLERYPDDVRLAEEGIKRLEDLIARKQPIPANPSEFTCYSSYGECPSFEFCRWGAGSA